MKDKLENLLDVLKQMQKKSIKEYNEQTISWAKGYCIGEQDAFAKSAQWLSDILNSENPNSVSNQPTEE
jgi:hypothetical protein